MRLTLCIAATALLIAPLAPTHAQSVDADVPTVAAAAPLQPFVASYQVLSGGRTLGAATMQLVALDAGRWRVDLTMRGAGVFRIAGINAEQSTVFDEAGGAYRPLSQSTVRKTLFTRKQTTGTYDWASQRATWTGDVKPTRRRPVELRGGDMSGLLINLAVIRDAQPGRTLQYRFVDDGRTRDHRYDVAAEHETVQVADLGYSAMRVDRAPAGAESTTIWVAAGVPTPVRILQREDGRETYDLRLVEYTGVPQ